MKKIILFLIAMVSFSMNSQNFEKSWTKVYEFEYAGKIKLASEEVNKIYKKARKKNDQPEIIRTFIYQSKFSQTLEEEAQFKIIENLKKEINTKDVATKAIFHYLYATFLSQYYEQFRYSLKEKTATDTIYNPDFKTWSYATFETEIENSFQKSIENHEILLNTPLIKYEKIIDFNKYERELNLSLYDFLVDQYIENIQYSAEIHDAKNAYSDINNKDLYGDTNAFQKINFSNLIKINFYKKLSFYQKLEKNYASKNNQLALSHIILKRLTAVSENKYEIKDFIKALENLSKKADERYKSAYQLKMAEAYKNNASKIQNKDYNKKAIALLNQIIQKKQEPFYSQALEIKKDIEQKNISVITEKYLITNQKNRALVSFTNVDTIFGSIYRVPNNFDRNNEYDRYYGNREKKHVNNDSLYLNYITKHEPYKSFESILPNKEDYFSYGTEIIFPELETGTYLLVLNIKKETLSEKSIVAYSIINATEIAISSTSLNNTTEFQVVNRKTGKPIENANIESEGFSIKTKNDGKATIAIRNNNNNNNNNRILVTYQKDTLSHSYSSNNYRGYENQESEKFKAKVNFFTDRSIYRPGQTVYFKGIFTQLKDEKTSIVANMHVNIIVEDANNNEIFTSRVKSNEFGSFAGEFIIPKNVLTGSFQISAEEDIDYTNDDFYDKIGETHPFWDNIDDFEENHQYFNVEEYKRPKFEINFDPIKENFIVNQNIKIKGNANAFTGSKISETKVSYRVKRNSYYNNWYYSNSYDSDNIQIKQGETKTDENGNFEIEFTALPAENFDEKGLPVFNYTIQTDITDINGETRSKSTQLKVGYHSLELTATISPNIDTKNSEEILIDSKNLNGQFVPIQGEIKIYKLKSPNRILRNRSWNAPEIQTISKKDFENFFPSEPYTDESDLNKWEKGSLVFSKTVDTETAKKVLLKDLKNWISGEYKLFFNAKDAFGKDIEVISNFNLSNQQDKKLADNQLFQFKILNDNFKKEGFIEMQFSSAAPQLYITTDVFYKSENTFSKVTEVKDGKKSFKIPIDKNGKGDMIINMSFVWENQQFTKTASVYLPETKESISIETSSMRNKIEPGSNEIWAFLIKDQNKKATVAEALATMYDASLDEFTKETWNTNLNFNTSYYNNAQQRNFLGFRNNHLSFKNIFKNFTRHYKPKTEINWFGFNFTNPDSNNSKYQKFLIEKIVIKRGETVSGFVTENGFPLPGVSVAVSETQRITQTNFDGYYEIKAFTGEILEFNFIGKKQHFGYVNGEKININMDDAPAALEEVVVVAYGTQKREAIVGSVAVIERLNGSVSGLNIENDFNYYRGNVYKKNVIKKDSLLLAKIQTRKNLSETAFFLPLLQTDTKGNLKFNFTSPEALTKWKLRILAHNKKATTGYLETSIITQKDLMILPNIPRFLREKDTIIISSKISNITPNAKTGIAMLQLFDAMTMQAIDAKMLNSNSSKNFSIKPNGNTSVSWKIYVPEGLQGVQYKIVAKAGNFSDGEENILPVLTNNMLVTESIPVWVRENSSKEYTFENLKNNTSTTLRNQQLTFEYTSNPTWLAIQSLPYLIEYEHECAEQTFARYYANALASEILNSNPKIAEVFESWKKSEKPISKLEQNEELKSILLTEIPWITDALSEEEKKKNLATLFDLQKMKESQKTTFDKLTQKQKASGGFAWFDGGEENEYVTRHIISGLGHLRKLTNKKTDELDQVSKNGIDFLDQKFLDSYIQNEAKDNQTKLVWKNPYKNLHYLYARSLYFDSYPMGKNLSRVAILYVEEIKKSWLQYSLYEKGLASLVLSRFGEKETAKKILENLRQTSSNNEKIGRAHV